MPMQSLMVDSTPGIVLGSISAAGFALFCLWVRGTPIICCCPTGSMHARVFVPATWFPPVTIAAAAHVATVAAAAIWFYSIKTAPPLWSDVRLLPAPQNHSTGAP